MPNKLSRYADGVMEAAWLAAVVVLPVYFNLYSSRIFEPDKIALLRSLALIVLAAWLVKIIAGGKTGVLGEANAASSWRSFIDIPLVKPALALLGVTLLATGFSLAPRISWWGSYQRLQGAFSTLAFLILFFALLFNLSSSHKLARLVTALIAGSLPVVLYGILQRYQLDPIPWGGDVTIRVAANLGNSIFVAAYLIMVIPLTAGRTLLALRGILKNETPLAPVMIRATLYLFSLAMQVYCLYLSGSRGPFLGFLAGGFLMVMVLAVYSRKHWLAGGLAAFTVLGIIFLALFNTQGGFFESLRNQPAIGRFGKLLDPTSNTALVRKYIWQGAARLVAPHAPLTYPDDSPDRWNSLRLLAGYGPEAMIVAYPSFYPPELAHVERRNATPDRSHNEVWDTLITSGLLGLAVYLGTILALFFWGLKWLGCLPGRRWQAVYWVSASLGGLLGSLALLVSQGFAFIGVGLPLGILLGLVLYVLVVSLSGKVPAPASEVDFQRAVLLLGVLTALLAHFVETNFGIAIGVTRAYFWVYAAILVLAGNDTKRLFPVPGLVAGDSEPAGSSPAPTPPAGRRRKNVPLPARPALTARAAPPDPTWLDAVWPGGLILALILGALGYIFLTNPGGADGRLLDVWASLTRLQSSGPGASWAVVGLILVTGLVTVLLLGTEAGQGETRRDWWKVALGCLAAGLLPAMLYWVWHARSLLAISSSNSSTLSDILAQVQRFEALPGYFWAFILSLVFLTPLLPGVGSQAGQSFTPLKITLAGVAFSLAIWLGVVANLKPIQADVAFKLAGQFTRADSWPVAIQIYQRAIRLAPAEDYYRLFLGQANLESASSMEAGPEQNQFLAEARDNLLAAQELNPLNPDHTANLARLYNLWALWSTDPDLRQQLGSQSEAYFSAAVRLSPTHARLWDEWSLLQRDVFRNEQRTRELLDRALAIDPQYDWTHALVGDLYLRQATESDPASLAGETSNLLEKAAGAYQNALTYVDPESIQSIATYKLALANVYRRLEKYPEAITLLSDPSLQQVIEAWRIAEQLGRLYQLAGERDLALAYARQALALAPAEQQSALQAWLADLERAP